MKKSILSIAAILLLLTGCSKAADTSGMPDTDNENAITTEASDTAAELIRNIDTAGINLPIYHYEGYEGDDVFQYYDIPSRFEIPSALETITEEKAGEIYYSAPNRLILFYGDAQIEGEYTKVGYIDDLEQFRNDVKNNPIVEGWGNLIIRVTK